MKTIHTIQPLLLALSLASAGISSGQTLDPTVNFTLGLNTAIDGGASYTNLNHAGAGVSSAFVIGFQVDINSVNGTPITLDPIASFCIELAESIGATTYNFNGSALYTASAGRAGEAGTASSNIPVGGIGQLRAARIRFLFDNFYQSMNLGSWSQSTAAPNIHAFQLALWEVSHDSDLSLTDSTGAIYFTGTQGNTLRDNAVALAENWLDAIDSAGVTESYVSTTYDVWALTSTSGNGAGGFQDVMLALRKDTPEHSTLVPLLPVPEPGALVLALLGTMGLLRRRRA